MGHEVTAALHKARRQVLLRNSRGENSYLMKKAEMNRGGEEGMEEGRILHGGHNFEQQTLLKYLPKQTWGKTLDVEREPDDLMYEIISDRRVRCRIQSICCVD